MRPTTSMLCDSNIRPRHWWVKSRTINKNTCCQRAIPSILGWRARQQVCSSCPVFWKLAKPMGQLYSGSAEPVLSLSKGRFRREERRLPAAASLQQVPRTDIPSRPASYSGARYLSLSLIDNINTSEKVSKKPMLPLNGKPPENKFSSTVNIMK